MIHGCSPLASARRGCRKQMIALCERADDEANLAEDLAPHIERLKTLRSFGKAKYSTPGPQEE